MYTKAFKTWLLVSYLAVLLSCGDALHRLPCFGHHHPAVEESSASESTASCSCSIHANQCVPGESAGTAEIVSSEPNENQPCLICEFFDEYQASMDLSESVPMATPHFTLAEGEVQSVYLEQTPAVARGPPVV